MDVQKYIKRLKFARADKWRNEGQIKKFADLEEAKNFLNEREFFFGDPFVVKYGNRYEGYRLALAIGKADNVSVEPGMTGVTGAFGEDAYELIDINEVKDQLEELNAKLEQEIADRETADEALQENINTEA